MQIEEKVLIEQKALNARRHEDLLNAIFAVTAKLSIPSPWNNFCSLFCTLFSPLFFNNCFALSDCAFWLIMVYANLGWLCSHTIPLLVFLFFVCAWLGWPISLTYHILECIAGCFSHITQVVVTANTLVYLVCSDHLFSMMPKGGRWAWPWLF